MQLSSRQLIQKQKHYTRDCGILYMQIMNGFSVDKYEVEQVQEEDILFEEDFLLKQRAEAIRSFHT